MRLKTLIASACLALAPQLAGAQQAPPANPAPSFLMDYVIGSAQAQTAPGVPQLAFRVEPDFLKLPEDMYTAEVVGVATNTCCESTARDAQMLNYKVIMIPDGNATRSDVEHSAALSNHFKLFGDVLTTAEVLARIESVMATRAPATAAAA